MKNTLSRKAKLFILSVLMPLSMMSIGFSSWTITSVHNVNGSFTTETVLDKGTYITACEVEYFEYMSTGFFTYPETESGNHTPQISDVGYLTATLTINLEKCRNVFTASNDLELQIELLNSATVKDDNGNTLSLFPYFTTATYAKVGEDGATVDAHAANAMKATASFAFTPDTTAQSVTYTITFKIDATETVGTEVYSIFESKVYPILQAMTKNNVAIIVQAAITEVTE